MVYGSYVFIKASPTESPLRFCEGDKVLTEENLLITIEPDNKEPARLTTTL
jgi:hypothetical protein